MLNEVYDDECKSRARDFEWHKRFYNSGKEDVEYDDRLGRPTTNLTTSLTNENVYKFDKIIRQDCRLSIKHITTILNIYRESVHRILIHLNAKIVC